MRSQRMRTSRVVGLTALVGVFFTAEEVLIDLVRRQPSAAGQDVVVGLVFWGLWAALAPLVLATARRWPIREGPRSRPLLVHAAVSVTLSAAHNVLAHFIYDAVTALTSGRLVTDAFNLNISPVAFVWGLFTSLVLYALIVMAYGATVLEAELTRSKLDMLRSQLRPHFLFNTLNAISVFITEDAPRAQRMILRLSSLLRRSLDEEAHEVPLSQELEFVTDYLDIQRGRFGDRLDVQVRAEPPALDAKVPVFLLQPLLENAIEHGRADDERLTVALTAAREGDALRITITDDGVGIGNGTPREGVGLTNTRARIDHLYGPQATVELGPGWRDTGSEGTRVDIRIPFRASLE